MPLLSAAQSRAGLTTVCVSLSAVALVATTVDSAGVVTISGDMRDYHVPLTLISLVGISLTTLLAGLSWLIPRWQSIWDRLTFDLMVLLSWLWTSCSMSFSGLYVILAYNDSAPGYYGPSVPSCASLTTTLVSTLAVLHVAGMTSAALALVILAGACTQKERSAFLLWEMALAPLPEPEQAPTQSSYGAIGAAAEDDTEPTAPPRDKFDDGRLWCYLPLVLFSLGAIGCSAALVAIGEELGATPFVIAIGSISTLFAAYFITTHRRHRGDTERKVEVILATALLTLWPCCAIALAIYPGTSRHPCRSKPEADAELDTVSIHTRGIDDLERFKPPVTCAVATVTFAWLAAWILFARLVGLVFPTPDVAVLQRDLPPGPEGASLLGRGGGGSGGGGSAGQNSGSGQDTGLGRVFRKPLVSSSASTEQDDPEMGGLLAGAEFELGDDEEHD